MNYRHIPPFFKILSVILVISLLIVPYSLPKSYGTDSYSWKISSTTSSAIILLNSTSGFKANSVPQRFYMEIRVNATDCTTDSIATTACFFVYVNNGVDGSIGINGNGTYISFFQDTTNGNQVRFYSSCSATPTQINFNWGDGQFHTYKLVFNGSGVPKVWGFIDGVQIDNPVNLASCFHTLSTSRLQFIDTGTQMPSGSVRDFTVDYVKIAYDNNGTTIYNNEFQSSPPTGQGTSGGGFSWQTGYNGYTINSVTTVDSGAIGTSLDLIAKDSNNNSRVEYPNGESFFLDAFLFGNNFGPLSGERITFQRNDSNVWINVGEDLTDSDGIAEIQITQFNKFIGQTTQYRSVYQGAGNYSGSISNVLTITTISFTGSPNRVPTAMTLEPVRRVINVDEFGVRESLEVNYEFGLFQNWRLRSYLYKFVDLQYQPLEGQQVKFYIAKNSGSSVLPYVNFANATTDNTGLALTPWFSFDNTWSGRSAIKVLYDGTFTYSGTNSTSTIIAINSQQLRLTLNINPQLVQTGSSTKAFGYLTRNSTLTPANLTLAIPNENVRIWINSSIIPFGLLGTVSTDANGYYQIEFLVPSISGTYFLKANSTVPLYNANVSSPIRQFTVKSLDPESDLQPDSLDIKEVFLIPLSGCADKVFCGYLFWIVMEIIGIILFGLFPMSVINKRGREINPTMAGLWLSMIFLSIFGFGWILEWLPVWSPILVLLPTTLILVGYLTQRKSSGE